MSRIISRTEAGDDAEEVQEEEQESWQVPRMQMRSQVWEAKKVEE